jgi:hypothetical protein
MDIIHLNLNLWTRFVENMGDHECVYNVVAWISNVHGGDRICSRTGDRGRPDKIQGF